MDDDSRQEAKNSNRFARRNWLDPIAALAMIVASGVVVYVNLVRSEPGRPSRPSIGIPSDLQALEGAPVRGYSTARVVLIEYSDFQCPYCGKFARDVLVRLEKDYVDSGRVLLAFRHLPLAMHPFAQKAAEGAECAARQGKFWQMHDKLFQDQGQLDEASLRTRALTIGIEEAPFSACLAGQATAKVKSDAAHAATLGLSATPAFLIGTVQAGGGVKVNRVISGAKPISEFTKALDELLTASAK